MNPDDQLYVDKKLTDFENVMLRSQKPQWGIFIALLSVGITILGGMYAIVVIPIHNRIDKLERHLDDYAQKTLDEHTEMFKHWKDLPQRPK